MKEQNTINNSLRYFLHVVFKRKRQILLIFLAIVCIGTTATLKMKPIYEADSQLFVKLEAENPFLPTGDKVLPVINFNREEQVHTEIELLKSPYLVENVVESIGPTNIYPELIQKTDGSLSQILSDKLKNNLDAFKKKLKFFNKPGADKPKPTSLFESAIFNVQESLKVRGLKNSRLIEVSFKHNKPDVAASVVNNLVNNYFDLRYRIRKNPKSSAFFQEKTQDLKNQLEQTQEKLKAFKKQHSLISFEEERSLLLRQASDLRAQLNQSLSLNAETENRILHLKKQLNQTPKTVAQEEETDRNTLLISTLEARLVELELEEKGLSAKYNEQSRLVQNIREEMEVVRKKLTEQEGKQFGRSTSGLNTTYLQLKQDLFRNEVELQALKAKMNTQQIQLSEYQDRLKDLDRNELQLMELQGQLDEDRKNYQLYLDKLEESRIDNEIDTKTIANVSLIRSARPPSKPVSPKVFLNIVISVVLGILGGMGYALTSEFFGGRLERPEEIEDLLQAPVLASIPKLKF